MLPEILALGPDGVREVQNGLQHVLERFKREQQNEKAIKVLKVVSAVAMIATIAVVASRCI